MNTKVTTWLMSSADTKFERFAKNTLFVMLFSFIANGFSYMNLMPRHDSVNHTLYFAGGFEVSLGRWMQPIFGQIKGAIAVPLLSGLMSAVFITVIVYTVCEILELYKNYEIILVSGLLSTNLCLTELNSTFQYVVDAFMLSAAFAAVGAYVLIQDKCKVRGVLASAVLLIMSMGMYQGEIVIAPLLIIFQIIKDVIRKVSLSEQIKRMVQYFCSLLLAAVGYLITYKLFMHLKGVSAPNTYSNLENLAELTFSGTISQAIMNVLRLAKYLFFTNVPIGWGYNVSNIVLLFLAFPGVILLLCKRDRKISGKVILLLCVLVTPFVMTAVLTLMSSSRIVYHMAYGVYLLYPLLFMFSELFIKYFSKLKNLFRYVIMICGVVLLFVNIRYSNAAYTIEKLMYDRTILLTSQLENDLNQLDEYEAGVTKVVMIGNLAKNDSIQLLSNQSVGICGYTKASAIAPRTISNFSNLLGLEIKYEAKNDIVEAFKKRSEVENMPSFPKKGYIQVIDDRIVVKLSSKY